MKPSSVFVLVLTVAAVVAVFSYNPVIAGFLIAMLLLASAMKLARRQFRPPDKIDRSTHDP